MYFFLNAIIIHSYVTPLSLLWYCHDTVHENHPDNFDRHQSIIISFRRLWALSFASASTLILAVESKDSQFLCSYWSREPPLSWGDLHVVFIALGSDRWRGVSDAGRWRQAWREVDRLEVDRQRDGGFSSLPNEALTLRGGTTRS